MAQRDTTGAVRPRQRHRHPLPGGRCRRTARRAQQRHDLDQPDLGRLALVVRPITGHALPSISASSSRTSAAPAGPSTRADPSPTTCSPTTSLALIDALGLDRPFIGGYGDGGEVATIVGIRQPQSVRAIVNHGGFDLFNPDPQAPGLVMTRQMLGGRPDATEADPDAVADHEQLSHDGRADEGRPRRRAGHRALEDGPAPNLRPGQPAAGYTVDDMRGVTAPTLVIVGDRDPFCTVEEGAGAYRALPDGELAVLPNIGSGVSQPAVQAMIEFFERLTPIPRL